jgi:DNA repair protein RadA/Sms
MECMAKVIVQHVCSECGTTTGRWLGKCPGCGAFGSLVEELSSAPSATRAKGRAGQGPAAEPRALQKLVDVSVEEAARISTGVPELDRVLGGGLVPASLVLVGGEPGVGKSTLLLTALGHVTRAGRRALLVTGEESVAQVKLRAERLGGAESVEILAETELETVCATLERERPDVCVIDSVQTLYAAELGSAPGSVGQVREAAGRLLRVAKEEGIATILVGHVTKDGSVAGPRVLEHLVDCVLQFEGDRYHAHRILRAVKNRFGSTNELGVFEMTVKGLVGVPDPSELFGRTHAGEVGAAVACALEGTRPILLEIQSLVSRSDLAMPRRVATGVDPRRLAMIVAVLSRHAGVALGAADVFVNVAGGVRIDEPGADLAIALAIASAARGVPVRDGLAAFGEIGLTGRLRPAAQAERRLEECAKLGLRTVIAPEGTARRGGPPITRAETLRSALAAALEGGSSPSREAVGWDGDADGDASARRRPASGIAAATS